MKLILSLLLILCVYLASVAPFHAAETVLIENGQPRAGIVVAVLEKAR
ncbi:MAG: hypothetical protein ACKVY0_04950 [Prosthecobacter sp.]